MTQTSGSNDRAFVYLDDQGEWRWVRKSMNYEIVGASTEGYVNRIDCLDNYRRIAGVLAPLLEVLHDDPDAPEMAED